MFKNANCENVRNFSHLDEKRTHRHTYAHSAHTLYSTQCTQSLPLCDNTHHLMHEYELDFKVQEREWKRVPPKPAVLPKCVYVGTHGCICTNTHHTDFFSHCTQNP